MVLIISITKITSTTNPCKNYNLQKEIMAGIENFLHLAISKYSLK